jgi:hypothetical protein
VGASSDKVITFTANGRPIRTTVVWTDPPAPANTAGLDDATPTLQHNLNTMLIAPDGTKYFPCSLVRANPQSAATTTGPNSVDNVEVIDASTLAGQWKLEVSVGPLTVGAEQPFALVISGLDP